MNKNEEISVSIIFGLLLLVISFFLPWVKYIDAYSNYEIDLNAINLIFGTYGMGVIQWDNWLDTYGFNIYNIPLILPLIYRLIGVIMGYLRFFEKFD